MIDEDAYGLLFSYTTVEDDEYASDERGQFVERFEGFEAAVLEILAGMSLPSHAHILCLGHAVYAELRDEEETPNLLRDFRLASARLEERGYVNVAVLSYGSRWVEEDQLPALSIEDGPPRVVRASRPSEPLRRALDAETLARRDEAMEGWGPGVYVDTEALEALGKVPKNAPTVLYAYGAEFFRIPPLREA